MADDVPVVDEPVNPFPPKLTVDALGLPTSTAKATYSLSQYVELERDGEPWCTWEDAEDMLVRAVQPITVGMAGKDYSGYNLTRDETKSILTLALTGG